MPKNVQSIIDDLESGLAALRMHFESFGSIFGEMAAPQAGGIERPWCQGIGGSVSSRKREYEW